MAIESISNTQWKLSHSKQKASFGMGVWLRAPPSGGLSWSINGNGAAPQSPQPQGEWVETTWVFGSD